MIYKRHTHSKIIFVSFYMNAKNFFLIILLYGVGYIFDFIYQSNYFPIHFVIITTSLIFIFGEKYLNNISKKIIGTTATILVVNMLFPIQTFLKGINSNSSNCSEYTVESSALSYARANYGAGASATGCTFNTGTVRKSGDTYSVTVFCGGNNPIDFTYECTNSGLQLVSVN